MLRQLILLVLLGFVLFTSAQQSTETESATTGFDSSKYKVRYGHELIGTYSLIGQHIIQGTKLVPQIRIDATDSSSTIGWKVTLTITLNGNDIYNSDLDWSPQTHLYTGTTIFDSSNLRGRLSFKYNLQVDAENSFQQTETYTVGYGLTVTEDATRERTKITRNNVIGLGTDFHFSVTFFNETSKSFKDGSLSFLVADASAIKLYDESKTAEEVDESFEFEFKLDASTYQSLVGGPIYFQFDAHDSRGPHSKEVIVFKYPVQMVASEIQINGGSNDQPPVFEIGQEIVVSMKPGSTPIFPNIHPHEAISTRQYFIDVNSETGGNIWSLKGEAQADGSVQFRWSIPKTLDSNGIGLISFRFVTSSGESIALQNFDSANNDLHNDNDIAYKVNSQFELQELSHPQEDDFYYGNTISLKFRIRDIVAGSLVSNGRSSKAFLYLTQSDGKTEFVSTKKDATSNAEDEFEIDWLINVNSIPGKGKVAIVVAELEGAEKINFGHAFDVNIGGTIDTESKSYITSTAVSQETAFLAEFSLSCKDKVLISPQLRCVVSYSSGKSAFSDLLNLKVASNDAGQSSVSWTLAHSKSPSGTYRLSFYRENAQLENQEALFTIDLHHTLGRTTEPLIRFEWLLFISSVVGFILLEVKRRKLTKQ